MDKLPKIKIIQKKNYKVNPPPCGGKTNTTWFFNLSNVEYWVWCAPSQPLPTLVGALQCYSLLVFLIMTMSKKPPEIQKIQVQERGRLQVLLGTE